LAFDPRKHDLEEFLRLENGGLLQKVCNVVDVDGYLVEQYKTRVVVVPIGYPIPNKGHQLSTSAPALYRSFNYDDEGNIIASLPEIREWDETCEALAQGADPDDPGFPDGGVPAGLKVAKSTYEHSEANAVAQGNTVTVATKTLAPDEAIYLRHVMYFGENRARFQVYVNGAKLSPPKYSTWTSWGGDFWFNTANGGILYEGEETIEVKVTNVGEGTANFEASIGFVVK
jgi:hypothetical protein